MGDALQQFDAGKMGGDELSKKYRQRLIEGIQKFYEDLSSLNKKKTPFVTNVVKGAVAGSASGGTMGATIGMVEGPPGVAAGGVVGAVAGGVKGALVGAVVHTT